MPNLSKETIRKMRRVIKAILANAQYYDQGTLPQRSDCGTTCCAAGFAVWLELSPEKYKLLTRKYGPTWVWEDMAKDVLGLTDASYLFYSPGGWPYEFGEMYRRATTPKGRALALKACWEDFIAKDGKVDYCTEIPF
jgi:hypothetical protein